MCHLGIALSKKNEGRGEKGGGAARTEETGKRSERPSAKWRGLGE